MDIYTKQATEYFKQGYNCAQSVFLTFAEEFGIDKETALKLSSSFGGGMGRLREVCGAVTAMFAVAGLTNGYTSPTDKDAKKQHYELIQTLAKQFKEKHNTILCRELLDGIENNNSPTPSERTVEYYSKRPCSKFIETACDIIEKNLLK